MQERIVAAPRSESTRCREDLQRWLVRELHLEQQGHLGPPLSFTCAKQKAVVVSAESKCTCTRVAKVMLQESINPQEEWKTKPRRHRWHSLLIQAHYTRKCFKCIHILINVVHQDIAQEAFPGLSLPYMYPWAKQPITNYSVPTCPVPPFNHTDYKL